MPSIGNNTEMHVQDEVGSPGQMRSQFCKYLKITVLSYFHISAVSNGTFACCVSDALFMNSSTLVVLVPW